MNKCLLLCVSGDACDLHTLGISQERFHLSDAALTTSSRPANGAGLFSLEEFHLSVAALTTLGWPTNGAGLFEIL